MLVCFVLPQQRRRQIAANIIEAAGAAVDLVSDAGFALLVDEPAAASENFDGFFGELLSEAAAASDVVDIGLVYNVLIDEPAAASDSVQTVTVIAIDAALSEAATAASTEDGAIAGPSYTAWNPSDKATITLTNSNLTAQATSVPSGVRAAKSYSTGKYYFEGTMSTYSGSGTVFGLGTSTAAFVGGSNAGQAAVVKAITANGGIHIDGTYSGKNLGLQGAGVIYGCAVDLGAGLIWFHTTPSGNWNGNSANNPATGVGGVSLGALAGQSLFPIFACSATNETCTANFGATSFNGAVPSGFTSGWPA